MEKVVKTESEWRARLTPEAFQVCRRKGTEPAFAGKYNEHKESGIYQCICCGQALFASDRKFDSGSGWPSFDAPINEAAVVKTADNSFLMRRTEILCALCDAHLGHVFADGPATTGLRYCINSASLNFHADE